MIPQLLYTVAFSTGFFGLIFISEMLYNRFEIRAEITRKTAHIAACLFSLVFLMTFQSYWYVVILGVIFFLLLFIGKKLNAFKSIYAVKRKTAGSYLLPIAVCSLFIISKEMSNSLLFVLPVLILGISDPLAGIFGTVYEHKTRHIVFFQHEMGKTVLGSSVFFITALLISLLVLTFYSFPIGQVLLFSLCLAVITTFVEMISTQGLDNLTAPMAACLVLFLLVPG